MAVYEIYTCKCTPHTYVKAYTQILIRNFSKYKSYLTSLPLNPSKQRQLQ